MNVSSPSSDKPPSQKRKRETPAVTSTPQDEDEVVPFIECCSDGTYAVHDEAVEFLNKLCGPIGVVSIVGPYRTGKSTLLNRCLLQRQSLKIGSTVNACTKGILLVKHVLKGPNVLDGNTKPLPVIVLDTEGLGSIDATNTHDVRIFSMALLLSSLFMYNSVGSIDENALTNLSLVASICKSLHLDGATGGQKADGDADALANAERLGKEAFPPLLWIVRDFALQLVNSHNQQISPSEYLEQTLQAQGDSGGAAASADQGGGGSSLATELMREKNNLRKYIKACFPLRQCITMVRPVSDESMLQSLSTSMRTPVRKIFEDQMQYVRQFVMHNIREKRIGCGGGGGAAAAVSVTGPGLVKYAQSIVESINQGSHPVIRDTWSLITKSQFDDAVAAAKRIFTDSMRAGDREDMEAAERNALAYFRKQPLPTGREHAARMTELKEFFVKEKAFYEKLAARMSEGELETAVNAMHNEVVNLVDAVTAIEELFPGEEVAKMNYVDEMENLRSKLKSVRAAKSKCLECYDNFAADVSEDPACSRAASIAMKHHRQTQTWVGALAASLVKMTDLATGCKLDLVEMMAAAASAAAAKLEEESAHEKKSSGEEEEEGGGRSIGMEVDAAGDGAGAGDASSAIRTSSTTLCEKLEAALAELSSVKAQLDDRDDQLMCMRSELRGVRDDLAAERLKTSEMEDRLVATKGDMDETSRQRSEQYEQRIKEVEQEVQMQYMKQLEGITATVDKKLADAEAVFERRVQEADRKAQKMEDASKRHEAVRDHVIATCSKLREEIAQLNEVRLTERMSWATRLAEMEKAVISSETKRKRLEELYDPEVTSKLHSSQVANSQLATDLGLKTREVTRLQAELEEAKAARDKWNKLYYEENCKHREEILYAKYERPSLTRGHAATGAARKSVKKDDDDMEELMALRKK